MDKLTSRGQYSEFLSRVSTHPLRYLLYCSVKNWMRLTRYMFIWLSITRMRANIIVMIQSWGCIFQDPHGGMSLIKIPFILLATWRMHMNYTSPNPPAPQHERYSSSVPLEKFRYMKWAPIAARVSNYYSEDILAQKLTKQPTDRSYNSLFALLRYQLSWHQRTLHHLCPK